jgi:hypothetical protein
MLARLCFAGALLASGPSFAQPTNLRTAQADNCPGLQHCTMMHALCQSACERSLPDNPDSSQRKRVQLCLDNCQSYYKECSQKEMAECK